MQYKFFTFPVGEYDQYEDALNTFLRTHKVVEVEKYLITQTTNPSWCFCIGYTTGAKFVSNSNPKVNYETVLSKEEFARFEKLREIRKELAAELSIPAYAVFNNKELGELAKKKEINKEVLLGLDGFGEGRYNRVGDAFLAKL